MHNETRIKDVNGLEILDSRGNPTVRAFVELENGVKCSADVPSGASTGTHEALELRDGGKRYLGKGVLDAVKNIKGPLRQALIGQDAQDQPGIDRTMLRLDGTPQKQRMGANALLGISIACAKAAASATQRSVVEHLRQVFKLRAATRFPTPLFNLVNGGAHSDAPLDVQEFWVVPIGVSTFRNQLRCGAEIYHHLGILLRAHHHVVSVGDEGGYAPRLSSSEEVFEFLTQAVSKAGFRLKKDVVFGIDVGASELWDRKRRCYRFKGLEKTFNADEVIALYESWVKTFPLRLIEDGLGEDDWNGWKRLTQRLARTTTLVGDDLFVTNRKRLQRGIRNHVANAIIIKPNQIGTVTETVETAITAKAAHYQIVLSHRSGDTPETFVADLSVAVGADYVKFGAPARGERTEKYNRLLEIEAFGYS